MPHPLIVAIGHPYRRDDGVGPKVAERLRARGYTVIEHSGEGTGLMDLWHGAEQVVLIDAARSGMAPGTVHRRDIAVDPLPRGMLRCSSHLFGVVEAIEMARTLGRLPASLIIWAIEGGAFEHGEGLTAPVAAAVEILMTQIEADLSPETPAVVAAREHRPVAPVQMPGEIGGPPGPEPTRYGDWELKGRCTDF